MESKEIKFNSVESNLYVLGDGVYFGMDDSSLLTASRHVDRVIKNHIGTLKVTEADLGVMETRMNKTEEKNYTAPLEKYLDVIERRILKTGNLAGIRTPSSKLFGLSYLIAAQTIENSDDMRRWLLSQRDLTDPEKAFDEYEKDHLVYRFDRERTLEEIRKLNQELDPKIPDNYAEFVVVPGYVPSIEDRLDGKQDLIGKLLGSVRFTQLKAKDKTKIEEAKSELVERLKKTTKGPCLSLDAPAIFDQMMRLYKDAPVLIENYGDVLKQPAWQTRLFRLDP